MVQLRFLGMGLVELVLDCLAQSVPVSLVVYMVQQLQLEQHLVLVLHRCAQPVEEQELESAQDQKAVVEVEAVVAQLGAEELAGRFVELVVELVVVGVVAVEALEPVQLVQAQLEEPEFHIYAQLVRELVVILQVVEQVVEPVVELALVE